MVNYKIYVYDNEQARINEWRSKYSNNRQQSYEINVIYKSAEINHKNKLSAKERTIILMFLLLSSYFAHLRMIVRINDFTLISKGEILCKVQKIRRKSKILRYGVLSLKNRFSAIGAAFPLKKHWFWRWIYADLP